MGRYLTKEEYEELAWEWKFYVKEMMKYAPLAYIRHLKKIVKKYKCPQCTSFHLHGEECYGTNSRYSA